MKTILALLQNRFRSASLLVQVADAYRIDLRLRGSHGERITDTCARNLPLVLQRMRAGAPCPQEFEGQDSLAQFAQDGQNVHTSLLNKTLDSLVRKTRTILGITAKTHPVDKIVLGESINTLPDAIIEKLKGETQAAVGRSSAEVRELIEVQLHRVYDNLRNIPAVVELHTHLQSYRSSITSHPPCAQVIA